MIAKTRRRNRTFQAGGCPALPVLKTGRKRAKPPMGARGCSPGATEKGTNAYDTARATAALTQPISSAPITNSILPLHQASSQCSALQSTSPPRTRKPQTDLTTRIG
jgi:hypothetical protein